MIFDERRNRAYLQALEKVITPESVVLDLGAGLGILGLLAAQLGAKHVYLVEPSDVITVTKQVVKANGFAERVTCLHGRIEDVVLPEKVDVIISVFTGNFLLAEDLLPSLFYARDHYLKPSGVLLPDRATMMAVPATAEKLYNREIKSWSHPHLGIDYQSIRRYSVNAIRFKRYDLAEQVVYLATPQSLLSLNFYTATTTKCNETVEFIIEEAGICHGVTGWFNMHLGGEWVSTNPKQKPLMHWSAAFLPLSTPLSLVRQEKLTFTLKRAPFTDWHWRIVTQSSSQQQSTFLRKVFSAQYKQSMQLDTKPTLNIEGQIQQFILTQFDGSSDIAQITDRLTENWPAQYPTRQKALNKIQQMVRNHT